MAECRYTSTYSQTEVNYELHKPVALRSDEALAVPIESDAIWAAELFWTLRKNYILLLSGIEKRCLSCQAHSLATIPVNVTLLQCNHISEESHRSVTTPHCNCCNHV
jgi:hypothetical protein